MRIFLSLLVFSSLSVISVGQNNSTEPCHKNKSKVYQAKSIISYHQVGKDDILSKIAMLNDVSVENIKRWNNLSSDHAAVGSLLRIQKINYELIEQIEPIEPEVTTVSFDNSLIAGILYELVDEVNTTSANILPKPHEISRQIKLLSTVNNITNQTNKSKKKLFVLKTSKTTKQALLVVKKWSSSVFKKIKIQKEIPQEVFYANNDIENEYSVVSRSEEDEDKSVSTVQNETPVSIDREPSFETSFNNWSSISNNSEDQINKPKKKLFVLKTSKTTKQALLAVKRWSSSIFKKIKTQKEIPQEVLYANNDIENEHSVVSRSEKDEDKSVSTVQNEISASIDREPSFEASFNWISGVSNEEDLTLHENAKKVYHRVKIGQTIAQIAAHYNVAKEDIIRWNNLSSGIAKVKQRLLIYIVQTSAVL